MVYQKNIRRRVYDALNVLMAMGIITKEKKEIRWVGLPTNSKQDLHKLEVQNTPSSELLEVCVTRSLFFVSRIMRLAWSGFVRRLSTWRSSSLRYALSPLPHPLSTLI